MSRACVESATWTLPGEGTGGPQTVADFDSDGLPEIGIATASHYTVYERMEPNCGGIPSTMHPLTQRAHGVRFRGRWKDRSGLNQTQLYILDGHTGTARLIDDVHISYASRIPIGRRCRQ